MSENQSKVGDALVQHTLEMIDTIAITMPLAFKAGAERFRATVEDAVEAQQAASVTFRLTTLEAERQTLLGELANLTPSLRATVKQRLRALAEKERKLMVENGADPEDVEEAYTNAMSMLASKPKQEALPAPKTESPAQPEYVREGSRFRRKPS